MQYTPISDKEAELASSTSPKYRIGDIVVCVSRMTDRCVLGSRHKVSRIYQGTSDAWFVTFEGGWFGGLVGRYVPLNYTYRDAVDNELDKLFKDVNG